MSKFSPHLWTHFGDFFEEISILGIDEMDAGAALLVSLQNGTQALGRRRIFETDDRGGERLPRDIQPQRVPPAMWRAIEHIDPGLVSRWEDDPEKPEEWISVDWISGSMHTGLWEWDPLAFLVRDYHALRIETKAARALLADLAGRPTKRAGAPPGPRNKRERETVQKGIAMCRNGMAASAYAAGQALADTSLPADQYEKQSRRFEYHIQLGLNAPKNSVEK